MSKRFRIGLIIFGVCALGAVGWHAFLPGEPVFEGKPFSQWVWTMRTKRAGPEKENARAVVRQLAPQLIPLLLAWLREPDQPSLDERIDYFKVRMYGWLAAHHFIKTHPATQTGVHPGHRTIASWALAGLDPAGRKTVIPALIQMLGDKSHNQDDLSEQAEAAYLVLVSMTPESVEPLIAALSSPDDQVWALAHGALEEIGPAAKAAIPVLEKQLQEPDPDRRVGAAETLARLGGDPNKFIPVIIQSLPQVERDEIDYALDVLVRYKAQATNAAPVLLTILTNTPESTNPTDILVRREVKSALMEISPAAAAKAGVK